MLLLNNGEVIIMNKKLIAYRKHLEDEILENNNKAYEYKKAMENHQKKVKESEEILDLLNKGKKYVEYKKIQEGINGSTS